jgi:hypothetical protein
MPVTLIAPLVLALALGVSYAASATDWAAPDDAWMEAPDGFVWPESLQEVGFKDLPSQDLDATILASLESLTTPELIPAAWVMLEDRNSEQLLYVDRALSGTGGNYIYVVTNTDDGWKWIGEMLCKSLLVSQQRHEGWSTLTCVGQRALMYQRSLYIKCGERYEDVRFERHDLERGTVAVQSKECTL